VWWREKLAWPKRQFAFSSEPSVSGTDLAVIIKRMLSMSRVRCTRESRRNYHNFVFITDLQCRPFSCTIMIHILPALFPHLRDVCATLCFPVSARYYVVFSLNTRWRNEERRTNNNLYYGIHKPGATNTHKLHHNLNMLMRPTV